MGMGGVSFWQLIIVLVIFILPIWVWGRIVNKAGYSRWWVIFMFIPLVNIIMIWVFAYAKWPSLKGANK
jgi:hypothetical protein